MSDDGGLEVGDEVRVLAGPQRGRKCVVVRVMRMPREPSSSAVVLVRFADGGADYHVAANMERVEATRVNKEGGEG